MNQRSNNGFVPELVAPCGINCRVCYAFLRTKNKCSGCRIEGNKPGSCIRCVIINCQNLKETESGFCSECPVYPCKRLKQLDRRYRLKYKTSLMANLENIRATGISVFLASDKERWRCKTCGDIVCIHSGECVKCSN